MSDIKIADRQTESEKVMALQEHVKMLERRIVELEEVAQKHNVFRVATLASPSRTSVLCICDNSPEGKQCIKQASAFFDAIGDDIDVTTHWSISSAIQLNCLMKIPSHV